MSTQARWPNARDVTKIILLWRHVMVVSGPVSCSTESKPYNLGPKMRFKINWNTAWFKKTDSKAVWFGTVNGASTHARQLVAVFQVLCSLYGLTCVGYAQYSLEFVSRSPLIQVVGRNFWLYTDSLFAQIGDSNDKCSSSLEAECWNEDETHAAQQSPTEFQWTHERKKYCAA